MKKLLRYTFIAILIWPLSFSANANSDWSLESLMHKLAQINTLTAEFEEVKDFAIFSNAITVKGWINYTKPNYLERKIESPHQELTVIEDDVIRIERQTDGDSGDVNEQQVSIDIHPAVRTLIESIRATFAGDLEVLEKYYQLVFSGDQNSWLLILKPLQEKVKEFVDQVEITGSDQYVQTIKTIESDASESEITILNTRFN